MKLFLSSLLPLSVILSGIALVFQEFTRSAQALTLVPPDLMPGQEYRLVFTTDGMINSLSPEIDTYNTFVTNEANSVTELSELGTTWSVIGSTGTVDARDNTNTNPFEDGLGVPIYRLDGMRVANDYNDLWDGSLQSAINITQTDIMLFPPSIVDVYTGSEIDGTMFPGAPFGDIGEVAVGSFVADSEWILSAIFGTPGQEGRLYAMSGILSVPLTSVPEPSSFLGYLILGGLILNSTIRRTKKY